MLRYIQRLKPAFSLSDLRGVAQEKGLPANPYSRSLADCRQIMAEFVSMGVYDIEISPTRPLGMRAIVYLDRSESNKTGHVMLVEPTEAGTYRVHIPQYDGVTELEITLEGFPSGHYLVLAENSAMQWIAIRRYSILVLASCACGAILGGAMRLLRTPQRPLTRTSDKAIISAAIGAILICTTGCGASPGGVTVADGVVHNLGYVDIADAPDTYTEIFHITNHLRNGVTIEHIKTGCKSCEEYLTEFDGRRISPGETVRIPVTLQIGRSGGRHVSKALIHWADRDVKPLELTVSKSVLHGPLPSKDQIEFEAITPGHVARDVEFRSLRRENEVTHSFDLATVTNKKGVPLDDARCELVGHDCDPLGNGVVRERWSLHVTVPVTALQAQEGFVTIKWKNTTLASNVEIVRRLAPCIAIRDAVAVIEDAQVGKERTIEIGCYIYDRDRIPSLRVAGVDDQVAISFPRDKDVVQITSKPNGTNPIERTIKVFESEQLIGEIAVAVLVKGGD